ncbi:MAG: hypothetical protein HY730_05060 [Candidatus Tectomicrobia bacterium]|uniref:Uncharacterized protein n=1 Tax=Tectimicrobiota bacterium TaxID=2528274 RepID=A0A933GKV3_UNCTE|nr:hypothetical protein [Candidatus Tectomicrobia bacterium]
MVDKSRMYGLLICLGTVVAALFFLYGLAQRSYWAIAIPVLIGFLTVLALGFWIGWTIVTVKTESPAPSMEPQPQSQSKKEESPAQDNTTEKTEN